MTDTMRKFRIGIDIGGTFTDCVAVDDDSGRKSVAKSLTTYGDLAEGVLNALELSAVNFEMTRPELLARTRTLAHGTTVATNAMLERRGARTGLITTRGHEDALIIGRVYAKRAGLGEREAVHTSRLEKPDPIIPRQLIRGVSERVDAKGEIVVPLQEDEVVEAIDSLLAEGAEAIAVSLLWSFLNEVHERRIQELMRERAPEVFATFSCDVSPVLGEYERTATTAVAGYIGPQVVAYLETLEERLVADGLASPLLVMQGGGGLTTVADASRQPIVTLDSGPAGGVLGCRHICGVYDEPNAICTDVGGTSFEVGLVLGGDALLEPEPVVSQYTLRLPKVATRSIGSGGGSIAWLDPGGLLRVGPQSAKSTPGPACYGRGGTEPTVTDADLALGYIDPDGFLGGRMALDRDAAMTALARLGGRMGLEPEEVAVGIARIVNSQMADLIRKSTIEAGHDPRDCVLIAYGGAGPTHAAAYGADVGAKSVLVLPDSTAFSAEGMLTCPISHSAQRSRLHRSPFTVEAMAEIRETFRGLEEVLTDQFEGEGMSGSEIRFKRNLAVRYRQQVHSLEIELEEGDLDTSEALEQRFSDRYRERFGTGSLLAGGGIEVDRHRVVAEQIEFGLRLPSYDDGDRDAGNAVAGERRLHFDSVGWVAADVYDGDALRPGNVIEGPAVVQRMGDSVILPPGSTGTVDRYLTFHMQLGSSRPVGVLVDEVSA